MLPDGWHDTVIVLISEVYTPELISQYRPISLCNVLYKVILKMIALWLKRITDYVISPVQGAFVPKRLITDNILVAYESAYYKKIRKRERRILCTDAGYAQGL